ncbi:MAG: hypothetical protein HW376_1542 [candidate division NC10 bacterium]|nr:hypothetical protein [candidate division NC10 bacterium]
MVAEILEQSRLEVRYAADLPEEMGVLRDWNPDVLLLDVRLPGTSGLALLKSLRAVPGWKDLPIIICERSGGKWGPGGRTS